MVEVLVLYPEMSSSSNSPNKTRVIHVVLLIIITWHGLDEPTLKDPLTIIWHGLDEPTPKEPIFHSAKKKKKKSFHFFNSFNSFLLITLQMRQPK